MTIPNAITLHTVKIKVGGLCYPEIDLGLMFSMVFFSLRTQTRVRSVKSEAQARCSSGLQEGQVQVVLSMFLNLNQNSGFMFLKN